MKNKGKGNGGGPEEPLIFPPSFGEVLEVGGGCSYELFGSLDEDCGSFQKYLLAYLLLAKNGNILEEVKRDIFDRDVNVQSLNLTGLNLRSVVKARPGGGYTDQRSNYHLFPGLYDDIALDCLALTYKESLAVGTQLLVFGREVTGFAIWMYSLVRRDWSRCPPMNLPRCLFGSGSSGEIAIVAGGSDMAGHVLKCSEMYNSEFGGMSSHTDSLTCGEEYNLETRAWRRIWNMYPGGNRATQSPPLVAVVNNQLYAADQSTNEVKKYDKANNTWNVVRTLPVRADSSNGWGLAFKPCGDKLLVIGGHRGPQGEVIVLHYWCPEDGNVGGADWDVLSIKERAGAFVYNCAIMGC
ncbi:hypothetical protein C4D60_Mb01t08190 [Musa balbisiana]|uniref:Uncharacterized protein n=1 Tax=Musa balbisiana TaxID=52838 RepID=A0A4S8JM22_MUSBA|nr:hypothetical protein C4D60_Mb01t08190 [Musa balbisiana]